MATPQRLAPRKWLHDLLNSCPGMAMVEIERRGQEAGYSLATLKRAKSAIGAQSRRKAPAGWEWYLPERALFARPDPNSPPPAIYSPFEEPLNDLDRNGDAEAGQEYQQCHPGRVTPLISLAEAEEEGDPFTIRWERG